jgi:hypothetical protein
MQFIHAHVLAAKRWLLRNTISLSSTLRTLLLADYFMRFLPDLISGDAACRDYYNKSDYQVCSNKGVVSIYHDYRYPFDHNFAA